MLTMMQHGKCFQYFRTVANPGTLIVTLTPLTPLIVTSLKADPHSASVNCATDAIRWQMVFSISIRGEQNVLF